MEYYSIILSAGKGSRMQSSKPKVLHEVLNKPMVHLVLDALIQAGITNNHLVVGFKKEEIIESINANYQNISYTNQDNQLGTADAVKQVKDLIGKKGTTIITCGDTPLVSAETFKNLIKYHRENKNNLTILSTIVENPQGYGRIVRTLNQEVLKIVEQKDATSQEAKIQEINSGIYCIDNEKLFEYINLIDNKNAQEEYYLTDIIQIFKENNLKVDAFEIEDNEEVIGVNDLSTLIKVNKILKTKINNKHISNGVNIIDPDNTYIGPDVQIGQETIIYPNNHIFGKTIIGKNNILKISNQISDTIIGDSTQIGPMALLRDQTIIEDKTRIGNFVEIKNSKIAKGSKAAHLSYLGDSEVGEDTNIGCGVITANYDGINKHQTKIGKNNFIGSNVNLIAPLVLEDNVFIAAGTTVTQNISEDKFVIGRSKEKIKEKH